MIALSLPRKHISLLAKATVLLLLLIGIGHQLNVYWSETIIRPVLPKPKSIKAWVKTNIVDKNILQRDDWFREKFAEIKSEKLKNDVDNDFWFMNDGLELPLDVSTPEYYLNPDVPRPLIHHFDPRFTLNTYLKYIQHELSKNEIDNFELPFHWADWIDITKLHKFITNQDPKFNYCETIFDISKVRASRRTKLKSVDKYCRLNDKNLLGYDIFASSGQQTEENLELVGKSYLFSTAPPPSKIIFLTSSNNDFSYQFPIQSTENDIKNSLLHNGIVESLVKDSSFWPENNTFNLLSTFNNFTRTYSPELSQPQTLGRNLPMTGSAPIYLSEDAFYVNSQQVVEQIMESENMSRDDMNYVESLKYSLKTLLPPKYFAEAKLVQSHPKRLLGDHYDWRFFLGINPGTEEHLSILHRLIKNYVTFTRQNGIRTWIAHGTLLSWYWGGTSFPWDVDVDVQVPVEDLHRLARDFNQSLIVESIGNKNGKFDGLGRYFLDVGSFVSHRERGNSNNNIDARFIDIDTGAYIDITALSLSNTETPSRYLNSKHKREDAAQNSENSTAAVTGELYFETNKKLKIYNCRNNHFSSLDELSPLVGCIIDNQVGFVPQDVTKPLINEYGLRSVTGLTFKKYLYVSQLRMWMKTVDLKEYIDNAGEWCQSRNVTLEQEGMSSEELHAIAKSVSHERIVHEIFSKYDFINILHDDNIFKNYEMNWKTTDYHEQELIRLLEGKIKQNCQALDKLANSTSNIGSGIRPDRFMSMLMANEDHQYDYKLSDENLTQIINAQLEDQTNQNKS